LGQCDLNMRICGDSETHSSQHWNPRRDYRPSSSSAAPIRVSALTCCARFEQWRCEDLFVRLLPSETVSLSLSHPLTFLTPFLTCGIPKKKKNEQTNLNFTFPFFPSYYPSFPVLTVVQRLMYTAQQLCTLFPSSTTHPSQIIAHTDLPPSSLDHPPV
jgi:hypothetical protein